MAGIELNQTFLQGWAKTKNELALVLLLRKLSWQGFQFAKITFEELEKIAVQEIRELLDDQDD